MNTLLRQSWAAFRRLPGTVLVLSMASLLTDVSSEMIYPLLPLFLSSVLHAGALQLGIIEGVAESTASVLKLVSGLWTDRIGKRKPFIFWGYSLASFARPFIGLAQGWSTVLGLRFLDRVGKGLRTSARDALLAETTEPALQGTAFGFHQSMDHAGAILGPLLAALLLSWGHASLRTIFLTAAIPAALVILILATRLKESPAPLAKEHPTFSADWSRFDGRFKLFLVSMLVFTLGNSTDAFLLLRLSHTGMASYTIPLLWAGLHGVKMISNLIGGRAADLVDRRKLIIGGWIWYGVIYLGFAWIQSPTWLVITFLLYGIYFGLTEPVEKSLVTDLSPKGLKGSAFGYYHGVIGLGALPASLLFGWLWRSVSMKVAFTTGAGLALLAAILLMLVHPPQKQKA